MGAADPVSGTPGQASEEVELSGADVDVATVLAWAADQAAGRGADRIEVFAVVDHAGDRGLIRLIGG
ncbi:hypothetical protein [Modestobacter sp. SYSU DS0875]